MLQKLQIGCGMIEMKKGSKFTVVHFACNYSPAGNIRAGQPEFANKFSVYELGEPCSKCNSNMTCTDSVFCTLPMK